jgi:RNA polymerase sigma-70 factor (ECF subfamily)
MLEAWRQRRLVERAKRGDAQAFADLLRPELPALHQVAYYLARDADEAQDLAQEACVRAYQALDQFRSDAPLRPWLHRILRNVFLDRRKSAMARHEILAEDGQSEELVATGEAEVAGSPLDRLLAQETREALAEQVRTLPEVFQAALVLCDIQGLSYAEVCEITGLPLGTVKSRLARARLMLRDRILGGAEPSGLPPRKDYRGAP